MNHKLLEIIKDLPNCSHDNSYKVVCICRWYFEHCPQVKTFFLCKVWCTCPRRWIVTLQCLQGNCLVSICAPMSLIHTMFYQIVYCIICSVAFPKIISPQYEFWSGFIDCFIEQIICNTVYKGPIFPFTSSSTPISPLTNTPQTITSMQRNNN